MLAVNEDLQRHLAEPPYRKGEINGRWRFVRIEWPRAIFELSTRDGNRPWIALALDLTGYPANPPLVQFWDLAKNARLEAHLWPRLKESQAFQPNRAGLYIACDRDALSAHSDWAQSSPNTNWRPDIGVARYLSAVYGSLQEAHLVA